MKYYKVYQTSHNMFNIEIVNKIKNVCVNINDIQSCFLDEIIDALTVLQFEYVED